MNYWQQGDKVISPDNEPFEVATSEPCVKGQAIVLKRNNVSVFSTQSVLIKQGYRHESGTQTTQGDRHLAKDNSSKSPEQ